MRFAVLVVLTIDGVLSAVAGAFLLPLYVGAVPLPVSGLISGLANAAFVWAALQWTSRPRLAMLPLWSWLATTAVLTLGGPGGDIVLSGAGLMQLAPLVFLVLGAGPPGYVLWRLTSKVDA
ncbi:MAG: hypothetical protein QOI01_851 [Mycobacterium sp.]|nr:hypothetical protein [Mycobacterium sp.]